MTSYETLIPISLRSITNDARRSVLDGNNNLLRSQLVLFYRELLKAFEANINGLNTGYFNIKWSHTYTSSELSFNQMVFIAQNYVMKKQNDLSRVLIIAQEVDYNKQRSKHIMGKNYNYVNYNSILNTVIDTINPITDTLQNLGTGVISNQSAGSFTTTPTASFDGTGSTGGTGSGGLWIEAGGSRIYYSAGTVGIGTSTPNSDYALHIVGNVLLDGDIEYV